MTPRRIEDLGRAHRRQFNRFMAFIIAVQVLMVVGAVWLVTHPEKIGGFIGAIVAGATS